MLELSTTLFPFQYSFKILERQLSIWLFAHFMCRSIHCKSNNFNIGTRSLMLNVFIIFYISKVEAKKSLKSCLKIPFDFSQHVPNNMWQIILLVSRWKIGLISTRFLPWMCSTMFITIYAMSSWHSSLKLFSLVYVKSFVLHILWSRHQWSPYGDKAMLDQSKLAYFPTIVQSLDAKSTSWIFNTSMAISTFEITMWSIYPKCKYIIGPYFFASSFMEWCGSFFK